MRKNLYLLFLSLFSFSAIHAEVTQPPLSLNDNEAYTNNSQIDNIDVTYTRNFTNTSWQSLYLPFSLSYDDWKDDFEIGYINTVREYDDNDDGVIDKTVLEVVKMKSGSTVPNTPYLIRAKETGEKTLSVENTTVYKAEDNSVDCTTINTTFTFTGTYKAISGIQLLQKYYYVIDGTDDGEFIRATSPNKLKPYHWYMTIVSRNANYPLVVTQTAQEPTNTKQLFLTDNESYTNDSQTDNIDVTYTRNFTNTNWQALYLPFSLGYDDWKDDFELAYIKAVRQLDNNEDGVIDDTVIEIVKMKSGSTVPNMPYLIRAKSTGEKTLSVENTTVYISENNSVDCSTTTAMFTFTGNYSPISSTTLIGNNYYAMGGGKLIHSDGSNDLRPFRWYLKAESRSSRYNMSNAAKDFTISELDEVSETTGVSELRTTNYELPVYDINGRKVNENSLKPGIYIKNGRKFVVK